MRAQGFGDTFGIVRQGTHVKSRFHRRFVFNRSGRRYSRDRFQLWPLRRLFKEMDVFGCKRLAPSDFLASVSFSAFFVCVGECFGAIEQRLGAAVQASLIAFEAKDVISAAVDDFFRYVLLAARRVYRYDSAVQVD